MYKHGMSSDDYQRALESALREYETLAAERVALDDRLARLSQTIASLMRLCKLTPSIPLGLTDACRLVLKAAGHPLSAVEVRDQLATMGFDGSRYANELAAIHTVLKRLNAAGETQFVPRSHDRPAYQWRRSPHVLAMSPDAVDTYLAEHFPPRSKGKGK